MPISRRSFLAGVGSLLAATESTRSVDALRSGDPQIEVIGGVYREVVQKSAEPIFKEAPHPGEPERLLAIATNTLKPGEEKIIARRLKEIFGRA